MENQRQFLVIGLMAICMILYFNWVKFTEPVVEEQEVVQLNGDQDSSVPTANELNSDVPSIPTTSTGSASVRQKQDYIVVKTDLAIVKINTFGGVIEGLELLDEPISLEEKDIGFPLLKKNNEDTFIAVDGLFTSNGLSAPNHNEAQYTYTKKNYELGSSDKISVPLKWISDEGIEYIKTIHFYRNSYIIDIDYQVLNHTDKTWSGYLYAHFSRSKPKESGGFFSNLGRLPSHVGPAIYDQEDGYKKVSFKDIDKSPLEKKINDGWVAMLQHYFVGAWIPENGVKKQIYTGVINNIYRAGYKTLTPVLVAPNQTGNLTAKAYIGSKQQSRLKTIQKESDVKGLALTVDYGFLTIIADPLFVVLSFINDIVGNWGWAIILLTLLIKILFYPLSAKGFKSMAKMRKFAPRLKTLKERYKDDRQKYQMEMMALYKKEKINPVGGCLPMLIQMPVFLALYWVLLESVEMRHAPFALWLQDLSAPDPWIVLPVLMGASMWLQQKMNPAPMDEIQQKVMMIMPIALVLLFINFPQGLVLYWTVNNLLTIAQQWLIYRQFDE